METGETEIVHFTCCHTVLSRGPKAKQPLMSNSTVFYGSYSSTTSFRIHQHMTRLLVYYCHYTNDLVNSHKHNKNGQKVHRPKVGQFNLLIKLNVLLVRQQRPNNINICSTASDISR